MPVVEVTCPGCGVKLKAPETMIGKKAKCKKCQISFRIPNSATIPPPSAATPPPGPTDDGKTEIMMALPVDDDKTTLWPTPPAEGLSSPPSAHPFDFGPVKAPVPAPTKPAAAPTAASAASPPAPSKPASPSPITRSKPGKSRPATPAQPLSLDDDYDPLPLPKNPASASPEPHREAPLSPPATHSSSPAGADSAADATDNPFADFSLTTPPVPPHPPEKSNKQAEKSNKHKEQRQDNTSAADAEAPPTPRYQRPEGKRGTIVALVLSGVFAIAALALGITAIIIFQQHRHPPEQAKPNKEAEQPAPAPNEPNPPPVPKDPEPPPPPKKKEPEPTPPPKPPTPGTRPAVVFTRLNTLTLSPLPANLRLDDKPTPELIRHLETPLPTIKRIFPPADPVTGDTFVLSQTAAAVGDGGEKLALDTYGPAGNRLAEARIEYHGDGSPQPIADVHSSAAGTFFLASVRGKLHVWSLGDKPAKIADGLSPYAEKPEHAKAGVAAAFFAANPKHVVLVSTAGGVLLYDLETSKPLRDFLPPHSLPGMVALNRSIAKAPDGESVVVAVAGVLYQIAAQPDLRLLRKYDLGGDVHESKALAVSGSPGRLLYVFTTIDDKTNRHDVVILGCPWARPPNP
ncbi:MAG: hypothetical protein RMJ56_04750 [Gemmataceae bacterium]|nr:zinc-ribbon domain-containing protein [Gemmata sp.]MDW8196898.1 hypothetical protein [Gemmataceae bacterium]